MATSREAAPPAVSVVIPVWNPGPNITRCIDSLLAQTMPAHDFEIILVDDGSTDGTSERLDRLAEAHRENVRVLHIPPSGWPGKPRNVGIQAARGEFVHLVDNDDTLPPYALADMYAAGVSAGADVVLGRPASDFRGLNHSVYRATRLRTTLADFPMLTETLTPHKMFRRALLLDHDIRFPEGPAPLEDQVFVMRAYVHARAITVLCDRPYYFYLRRIGSGRNAGDRTIDPVKHFAAVEQVLDIVEDGVADAELRDRLFRRFYRVNLLARVIERAVLDADDASRRAQVEQVHRVVSTRFGPGVIEQSGAAHRILGRLLLDDDVPALVAAGEHYADIALRARLVDPRWRDGVLHLGVDAVLTWDEEPLRCERTPDGWALPEALGPSVPPADRLLDSDRNESDVELSLVSRASAVSFGIVDGLTADVDDDGIIRVAGELTIDPDTVLFGRPLDDGLWDLRVRLRFAGFNRSAAVRADNDDALPSPGITRDDRVVSPFVSTTWGAVTLDVGQWVESLATRVAASCDVRVAGRRQLELAFDVVTATPAPVPVEVVLEPLEPTAGGVITGDGHLRSTGGSRSTGTVRLPTLPRNGQWRPWVRVADKGAGSPAALSWLVRRTNGTLSVEALPD